MAKASTKTTTTKTAAPIADSRDENGIRTEPGTMAKRAEDALVKPDPDAVNAEPVSLTVDKNATKEQFAAADAAAARAVSGL